jgi:hypothetical protein
MQGKIVVETHCFLVADSETRPGLVIMIIGNRSYEG